MTNKTKLMETNDNENLTQQTSEDKTSTNDQEDTTSTEKNESPEQSTEQDAKTLDVQRKKWKEKAEQAEKDLAEYKEKYPPKEEAGETKVENQSNEPDYAKLAYLETKGIAHPDDQKVVTDEAERLKLSLTDVLAFDHIKAKLKTNKEQRTAQDGMPKGRGTTGGKTTQDVDYWVAKGELPKDQELAQKVVDAKIKKSDENNMFDPL